MQKKIQKQVNTWTHLIPDSNTESTSSLICIIFSACEHLPKMKKEGSNFPNMNVKMNHK